jgi:hypothetical protein
LTAWPEVKIEFVHEAGPISRGSIEDPIEALSRLELYIGVSPPPETRYKDLEAMAVSRILRVAPRTDTAFENKEATVPVEPGKYLLALVVKDVGSGLTGTEYTSVEVPTFEELTVNQ